MTTQIKQMEEILTKDIITPKNAQICPTCGIIFRGVCPFCSKGIKPYPKELPKKIEYVIPKHKICSRCKELKDINEFYSNINRTDAHDNACKKCRLEMKQIASLLQRKRREEYRINKAKLNDVDN